ncbi:Rel homology dimerization domain [Popillia japonica]|uniref:Rel homology dimerization domain n=1 Tax=Popillia japonica TaxID=7064 RepID=A0AAW1NB39_POPJA
MDTTTLDFQPAYEAVSDDNIDISDVIEVIETDPAYANQSTPRKGKMYNGIDQHHSRPRCVIVEEPAQKQLRFRYPCEGRSAGSIPGANSTPENKTYPTIKITGYKGKAIVVVSCVTKDEPYRPHPHHLVGREGCKKGVCTVQVPEDTMTVSFQNLGIQCVKKKDIEEALKTREEIRVDPFRTGFSHRNQPTSIDLNAVRLCFQVFLQGEQRGKYVDLQPVVSTPIYDKKAMCDLVIVKLSDCVCPVDGGHKDIILLCEKVAKEDIQIRFFEEKNNEVVWEGFGEFQPSQVHKQTAIWFKPPKYKTLDIMEPVKMFVQLRRPSDGATSTPVPFQMVPLGRPSIWSLRPIAKKRNYDIFSEILAKDSQFPSKRTTALLQDLSKQAAAKSNEVSSVETQTINLTDSNDKIADKVDDKIEQKVIDEVAELDELYAQTKKQLASIDDEKIVEASNNNFDDNKSYTSLQLAFKNPIDITIIDQTKYDDVVVPRSPIINVIPTAPEEEKLPPLPPKRAKKLDNQRSYSTKITDINDPSPNRSSEKNLHLLSNLTTDKIDLTLPPRSQSFSVTRPKSQCDLNPPLKDLPPTPCSTLPKPKKRKFFSGLMSYLSKSTNTSRETTPTARNSLTTTNSLLATNTLNRSASNISQHSSASIHIPLKDQPQNADDLNQNKIDAANENILPDTYDLNLDLTEAEHYALYTALAPHATQSEFDETSCYYAPVEEPSPNKRKLLELHEQYKNTPIPDLYRPPTMNISPIQTNVKDEPDVSRSPFMLEPTYSMDYQMNFPPNIPSTSTAQPVQLLPSFNASWGGPSTSYSIAVPNIPLVPDTGITFTDMDSLKQITINSDDLPVTSLTNMSLTDIPPDGMIDSLDRLANHEADRHLGPH